jgi:metal-responsive CopG/Arc/MetJ family transcriptional regulator
MKVKTSVSLSEDVIALIDQHADGERNRSAFIELAVRTYLEMIRRKRRDHDDVQTINRLSAKLNREARDVMGYQVELHG